MSNKYNLDLIFPEEEKEPAEMTPREGFSLSDVDKILPKQEQTKPTFTRETAKNLFPATVVETDIDVGNVLSRYQESLTKEDFLQDEELQELVIQSLEARGRENPNVFRKTGNLLTRITGGAGVGIRKNNLRELPFEDVFEAWQNYQRSFSAGHSVTVANELAYVNGLDDQTKAKLGVGYLLFDQMDNAFTGEGSWKEMGDAVWDYGKSAVWDPINILTFGLGKAISAGGTKAGSQAFRGLIKEAAKKKLTGAVIKAAPYTIPDLAINIGSDVAEQHVKVDTGAQGKYNPGQTALAAAGTIMIPAVASGIYGLAKLRKSKLFKGTAFDTPDLSTEKALSLSKEEAWEILNKNVKREVLKENVKENFSFEGVSKRFGDISGDTSKFNDWAATKLASREGFDRKVTKVDLPTVFFNNFWYGDYDKETGEVLQEGYMQALQKAGFRTTPSMLNEKGGVTSTFAQTIELIDDDTMKSVVKSFEEAAGQKMNMGYTSKEVAQYFAANSSNAGSFFNIVSGLRQASELGFDEKEMLEMVAGAGKKVQEPKQIEFALSIYKRLLTSHLATTGANLKGFQQLVGINTFADIFATAAYTAQESFQKYVKGDVDKAAIYARKAFGSWRATQRRVGAALSPDTEYQYALDLIDSLPEKHSEYVTSKLFRDIAGDGGVRDSSAMYHIDGPVSKVIDKVTETTQNLTLVRAQDTITKTWAFGANFDRSLERQFGVTATEFFNAPENALKINTKEFKFALDEAIFRTLRETASVNWSLLPAKAGFRKSAEMIESITNRSAAGFIVPFGSFLNTTIATLGDLSGVNLIRHMAKVQMGKNLDYASGDAGELLGKFAVGITGVALTMPSAYDKVMSGLAWDQERSDDGRLKEKTFIWPESVFELGGQILAHSVVPKGDMSVQEMALKGQLDLDWDRIPKPLWTEFLAQSGGQAVRDLDDSVEGIKKSLSRFADDPLEVRLWGEFIGSVLSRPIQGVMRPLDPVNQIVGVATGDNMNRDLRQGAKNFNQMFKYINNIVPVSDDLPTRADAVSGLRTGVDLGKQIMGNRTAKTPNLTQSMFNAAGFETWRAVQWNGPPEIKNTMDLIASNYFDDEARRQMREHPDFFKYPQGKKEAIVEKMNDNVKKKVIEQLENSAPSTLNMVRILSGKSQEKVRTVMETLGIEGDLVDLLEAEDGLEQLSRINFYVDRYDEVFHSDIK